jgi:hypothetical protein
LLPFFCPSLSLVLIIGPLIFYFNGSLFRLSYRFVVPSIVIRSFFAPSTPAVPPHLSFLRFISGFLAFLFAFRVFFSRFAIFAANALSTITSASTTITSFFLPRGLFKGANDLLRLKLSRAALGDDAQGRL